MAKNAIPAPPRSRLLPKIVLLSALALVLLLAFRHPADTAEWIRGTSTAIVIVVDSISEFIQEVTR